MNARRYKCPSCGATLEFDTMELPDAEELPDVNLGTDDDQGGE